MDTTDITPTAIEPIDPKRQRLAVLAEDTRTRMKRSALDIYHIGANLLEAQGLLAHGEFLPWIQAFGMGAKVLPIALWMWDVHFKTNFPIWEIWKSPPLLSIFWHPRRLQMMQEMKL